MSQKKSRNLEIQRPRHKQRKHAVYMHMYCHRVGVREPDCMRVPSQGPHGEKRAVRCYAGNVSRVCGILMNYFGNGPKTEANGLLRQMEADVVAVLLEDVLSGALLVSPSRPDGGTHHQAAGG